MSDFAKFCKENGIVLPAYDRVWNSGDNTYGLRHVESGEVSLTGDYELIGLHVEIRNRQQLQTIEMMEKRG